MYFATMKVNSPCSSKDKIRSSWHPIAALPAQSQSANPLTPLSRLAAETAADRGAPSLMVRQVSQSLLV